MTKFSTAGVAAAMLHRIAQGCTVGDSTLQCRLLSVLRGLEIVAVLLAVVLGFVALFAWIAVRRNRSRKLEPASTTKQTAPKDSKRP
jgi:hypothetical protein